MGIVNSPALAAKAKSMYGNRLKKEDYDELLRKSTVPEIAGYLKNETEYGSTMRDIYENRIHRGQLEQLIRQNMYEKIERLLKFSMLTNHEFYRLNIMKREIEVILLILRAIIQDEEHEDVQYTTLISEIPLALSDYFSYDIDKISETSSFEDILDILQGTPYRAVLKKYIDKKEEKLDLPAIEQELFSAYYQSVFRIIEKNFSGRVKKELLDIYKTQIELMNIVKIYRMKKFFKVSNEYIEKTMVRMKSRMSDSFIKHLIAQPDAESVLRVLESSKYNMYVDDKEYTYIEYYSDQIKYHLAKRYMRFSIDSPVIYTVYVILMELEISNITNIIEAVRYGTQRSEVESLLIY